MPHQMEAVLVQMHFGWEINNLHIIFQKTNLWCDEGITSEVSLSAFLSFIKAAGVEM